VSNRVTLAQLRDMTADQAAGLPVDQIAALLEDMAELKADTKRLDDLLHQALSLRYGDQATALRRGEGKDTGTVTVADGDFLIRADLPKKVEWDEAGLASVERQLTEMGEPAGEYIQVRRVVSEAAFQKWPSSLQGMFLPHRTVGVGRPTFKVERAKRSAA
jgi:hypothetical protein